MGRDATDTHECDQVSRFDRQPSQHNEGGETHHQTGNGHGGADQASVGHVEIAAELE